MTKFEIIFGIKKSEIKKTCILMPLLSKYTLDTFGIKNLSRGKIYSSGNTNHFTLINTGIGASFTGDAALHLSNTNCKNLILFGSCGLVKSPISLDIGSLVVPVKCYAMESFTNILLKKHDFRTFFPDKTLINSFLNNNKLVQKVNCATLGSLKLEEENLDLLADKNIHVVDMECSSLFSAAAHKHLKAMSLFYVSDIINEKPFYAKFGPKDKVNLLSSIKSGIKSLCSFIK
jgi:purine-nucleoside phosphorylase